MTISGQPPRRVERISQPSRAGLVAIPSHLRAAWWAMAEKAGPLTGRMDGYESFLAKLIEFLHFKHLPLPGQCSFDAVATRPGQASTRPDPDVGCLAGLDFSVTPASGPDPASRVVGVINLGDEPTHLVLLNLSPDCMRSMLAVQGQIDVGTTALRDLLGRFFAAMSAYPLVSVLLEPGDGLWLPECGVVYDGYTEGKQDLDIVLTIRCETVG